MGYETLCLLCGVSPGGGCISICASDDVSENAEELTNEIQGSFDHSVDIHEVVREVLELTANENFQRHSGLPDGVGGGHYNESDYHIVIGYFDQDGEPITRGRESKRIGPDGKRVVIRQTAGGGVNGIFREVLAVVNGENELGISLSTSAYKSEFNPCFALHEPCYFFLKAWLDRDQLPPRSCAFPSDPEPLSLASELYEIVNSQEETRDDAFKGCLLSSAIDYERIQDTLIYYQDFFINGRKDAKHLIQAIQTGLRGAELIPALYRDCRVYMFMRPNVYPEPSLTMASATHRPSFTIYPPEYASPLPAIARLPAELYFVMLHDLPLLSLLTLASTCRSLRCMILDPPFFDRLLKEAIMRGASRWLLPVDGVLNDSRRAYDALRLWLPADCRPPPYTVIAADPTDANDSEQADDSHKATTSSSPVPPVEPLIMSPQFPALAFVCACWESDSMMNRKRLWGQVKQFEELWRYYRGHGWRVNRFFPSSELVVHSDDPLVFAQPRT